MTLSNRTQMQLWSGTDLDSGASLVSGVIDTEFMPSLSIVWKALNAGGTAGVEIAYAVSADGVNFGSYDYVVVADTSAVVTAEDWHETAVAHKARYLKFRIRELKSLNNNVIDAYLVFPETI